MEEGLAAAMEFSSPALEELLPDLSPEEQLRLHNGGDACRTRKQRRRHTSNKQQPIPRSSERERDMFIIPQVHHALRHYNARHPGSEFGAVKPLMQCRVGFRDQAWFHLNFWARSRSGGSNTKLKRFFAEVHYKPLFVPAASSTNSPSFVPSSLFPNPIPIVEVCTIIEEPLSQYRSSCAFCPGSYDILHPKGSRKFVCGNDKDRTEQRLLQCNAGTCLGMPFTGSPCG
ncbi:unnamed protein product [Urochloa decumbens]|uniref:DUF3615 domain-containing protein n=1 Tax=Urochloa decumbens TaxID=240449 RepID=A0ABC9DV23_9POAL